MSLNNLVNLNPETPKEFYVAVLGAMEVEGVRRVQMEKDLQAMREKLKAQELVVEELAEFKKAADIKIRLQDELRDKQQKQIKSIVTIGSLLLIVLGVLSYWKQFTA